jgi:hypothetical protein
MHDPYLSHKAVVQELTLTHFDAQLNYFDA